MSVLTLDLLRHGDAEDSGCYRGRIDSALTTMGQQQMQAYGVANPGWQRVVTSPLRRCAEPARQIARCLNLECEEDARLLELDFGRWDGRPYAEVWQQESAAVLAFWQDPEANAPPGGERLADFRARLQSLQHSLQHETPAGTDPHVLLLTHGGVIRGLLGSVLGMEARHWSQLRIDTASLSRIRLGLDGSHRWCEVAFMNRVMEPLGRY